jgi:hypothetical protein
MPLNVILRWVQSAPLQPISQWSILIAATHLQLGFEASPFSWGFQLKFNIHFWSPPCMLHTPPISSSLISQLIILAEKFKLWSSTLCSVLHSPVTTTLLGTNIVLSTLFSYTLSLCSSLSCYYNPLRYKYCPQHFVLIHPQSAFFTLLLLQPS